MRLDRAFLGLVSSLSLALAGQAATTNILDWQFSTADNPASPTIAVNPDGGDPLATFSGPNNTYFFGTGPNGLFGSPTGLWDIEAGQLALTLNLFSTQPVDLTVVITQFADQNRALYPGTISWSIPGGHLISEVPVVPQTGNMIGSWYQDTYQWTAVDASTFPITLDIGPAAAGTGLLLDEVQFSIMGTLQVPEPGFGLLAGTGLLALAMRYWPRRKV
jgi:hypothetical protein